MSPWTHLLHHIAPDSPWLPLISLWFLPYNNGRPFLPWMTPDDLELTSIFLAPEDRTISPSTKCNFKYGFDLGWPLMTLNWHPKCWLSDDITTHQVSLPYYLIIMIGKGDGKRSWLVHLSGGGWCWDLNSCYERLYKMLGSSKNRPPTSQLIGIHSDDPSTNPDFYNWNVAMVNYCDGASFSGMV